MKVKFIKNKWEDKLTYAFTYRFDTYPTFTQDKDCIKNKKDTTNQYGYQNISLFFKEKYKAKNLISTTCSFNKYGAPLIVLAEDLIPQKDGKLRYGNYYEIVLYENGINVWRLRYNGKEVTYVKLMGNEFKVQANKKYKLSAYIEKEKNRLHVIVGKHKMQVYLEDCKDEYYYGIDACEGINKFYDISIQEMK